MGTVDELPGGLRKKVEEWLRWDPIPSTRQEIEKLVEARNFTELNARLNLRISFGTAGIVTNNFVGGGMEMNDRLLRFCFVLLGLRGVMQAGNSSMNVLTVIQASQGLCQYVLREFGESTKTRGIVIGYDGRHNSLEFARRSAITFASHGVRVYLFSVLVPTPFVVSPPLSSSTSTSSDTLCFDCLLFVIIFVLV
jgi:hypothetical protein